MPVINQGVLDGVRRIGAKVRDLTIDGGLPGAPLGFRLRGATTSGPPATGTWKAGDETRDRNGIIWFCTAGGSPGTWAQSAGLITSQVLTASAASITLSSIPSAYSQIRLVAVGASSTAAESTRWQVQINGDTGAHYDSAGVYDYGAGSVAASSAGGGTTWVTVGGSSAADLPGANATSGVVGILELVFPAYAGTTLQKVGFWRSGYTDAATATADESQTTQIIAWRSTAAITSIKLIPVAGSFIAGTSVYLYGS
jgi:hypothetical protein